jgi:hypothetical protein
MFQRYMLFLSSGKKRHEMEATGSTEMLVPFFQTTWCGIPDNQNLHMQYGENLKYHIKRYNNIKYEVYILI